jgi:hypothetical protein
MSGLSYVFLVIAAFGFFGALFPRVPMRWGRQTDSVPISVTGRVAWGVFGVCGLIWERPNVGSHWRIVIFLMLLVGMWIVGYYDYRKFKRS